MLKLGGGGEGGKIIEEEVKETKNQRENRLLSAISIASELGFAISLPIAGGAFLGNLLDSKFHTTPRMTLSFIFIGIFLAGSNIYFIIREIKK